MKQNQIFMVIGVIALLLVIFNWNKIFPPKMRSGGVSGQKQKGKKWCWCKGVGIKSFYGFGDEVTCEELCSYERDGK